MSAGWEIKKLGDLTDLITKGTTPTSLGFKFEDDGINFIKVETLTESGEFIDEKMASISQKCHDALRRSQIKEGDILFSIAGALGRTALVSNEILPANTNQALAIIRLKTSKDVLPRFILKALGTGFVLEQIEKSKGGVAQQNLSLAQVRDFQIPIPPIAEQQRIVNILDQAFEGIATATANAEQNLANARKLFESYLQSMFVNQGEGWEMKRLGDIGKPSMCKRILKHQTSSTGDIPFYKIGTFGKTPDAFISKEKYDEFRTKYSFPKKGDILISASGTIGRRVRYDGEPAFFQDSNIVWIDNDERQVLNDYLYVFYDFCDWQPSKGATISRLYNSNLTSIKIVFPKSINEQKKIVYKLNALSAETKKLEAIYQQKLIALEELKKSILHQAFTGQLN